MKALLIREDGTSEELELPNTDEFLTQAMELMDAEILDHFTVKRGELDGWVDDTSASTKQLNIVATSLVGAVGYGGNLFGNVILTGGVDEEGWTKSLEAAPGLKIWADRILDKVS
jgi:hypothetical protein